MIVAKKIIKSANKMPYANLSDKLNSILAKVKSSHDPVLIVNKDKLEGIVSASYALFKRRLPFSTKASSALKKSPVINENTPIQKIAKLMMSLDVYSLPVTDKNGIVKGVIHAKDLLKELKSVKDVFKNVKFDYVVTKSSHDKIRDIYKKLKSDDTSRLVIVDGKGKIEGIITRRDIQEVFMNPPSKGVSTRNKNNRTYIIDDRDLKKFDFTLGEFMKRNVVTLSEKAMPSEILEKILSGKINSVVLVDKFQRPVRIASLKNFLKAASEINLEEKIKFILTDHKKVLLDDEKKKIEELVNDFSSKINRSNPIDLVKGEVNAYRNKQDKITGFDFHFHVTFKDGNTVSAKVEDKVLWTAVKKSMDKAKNQLKRKDRKQD